MYQEFRKVLYGFPVIMPTDIHLSLPDFDMKNLIYWQKKGYVIKLRNGYYMFTDYKTTEHTLFHIANELYDLSYVSMESALSHYGLIPEGVYSIISNSPKPIRKSLLICVVKSLCDNSLPLAISCARFKNSRIH